MVLVDTTVLIDHFRGKETPEAGYFAAAVLEGDELCVCGLVITEILQGFSDEEEYRIARNLLDTLIFLPIFHQTYLLAVDIYREAKRRGHTLHGCIDCLIAACAITNNTRLLQSDRDYSAIAKFSKLKFVEFN